ncbi:acetyltransferase [Thermaurantiacus sp.]
MRLIHGLVGSGGFARETWAYFRNTTLPGNFCFVVTEANEAEIDGLPLIPEAAFLAEASNRTFTVCVGDAELRARLHARYEMAGAVPVSLVAPQAFVDPAARIGPGSILCPFAMVTNRTAVGRGYIGNVHSYLAHDCEVGDFVTLAPGARVSGNVRIGDRTMIGAGALVRQGQPGRPLRIGQGVTVGMGAVVLDDVEDGVTVVGNPARMLEKSAV